MTEPLHPLLNYAISPLAAISIAASATSIAAYLYYTRIYHVKPSLARTGVHACARMRVCTRVYVPVHHHVHGHVDMRRAQRGQSSSACSSWRSTRSSSSSRSHGTVDTRISIRTGVNASLEISVQIRFYTRSVALPRPNRATAATTLTY